MTNLKLFWLVIFGFLLLATGSTLIMNYATAQWWTEHFVQWFGSRYSFTFDAVGMYLGIPFAVVGFLLCCVPSVKLCERLENRPSQMSAMPQVSINVDATDVLANVPGIELSPVNRLENLTAKERDLDKEIAILEKRKRIAQLTAQLKKDVRDLERGSLQTSIVIPSGSNN